MNTFSDELLSLKKLILRRKNSIINEEGTKQSLILPFIKLLGFDIADPVEVIPEYSADFGLKIGEKVDYAICIDKTPKVFIEAKSVKANLTNHEAQLSRYFNSTPDVSIGIVTNGVEYRFFTDIDHINIMDSDPFFTFSFEDYKDADADVISLFKKSPFDEQIQRKTAEELLYAVRIKQSLTTLLNNPSDDFIRLIVKDFYKKNFTVTSVTKLRPIVEAAIESVLAGVNNSNTTVKAPSIQMQAYGIVQAILQQAKKDISELGYKETVQYFKIYNTNIRGTFMRFVFQKSAIIVGINLPCQTVQQHLAKSGYEIKQSGGETQIKISTINEVQSLSKLIVMAFK